MGSAPTGVWILCFSVMRTPEFCSAVVRCCFAAALVVSFRFDIILGLPMEHALASHTEPELRRR